jgi:hypothetical protein
MIFIIVQRKVGNGCDLNVKVRKCIIELLPLFNVFTFYEKG